MEAARPGGAEGDRRQVLGNVRRLEGAMTRVAAFSSMLSEPVTPTLAQRALDSSAAGESRASPARRCRCRHRQRRRDPGGRLLRAAASPATTSLSPKRTSRVSRARQLAMYLARERDLTLPRRRSPASSTATTPRSSTPSARSTTRLEPGSETTAQSPPEPELAAARAAREMLRPSHPQPQPSSTDLVHRPDHAILVP